MKKYTVEFIGTFFLVFTIGMMVIESTARILAPIPIGAILAIMIYAGGHISGGHYNPAVTLAVWLRGKLDFKNLLPYMIAQIFGAVVASFIVLYLKGYPDLTALNAAHASHASHGPLGPSALHFMPALISEFIFTFALCYVVLNVATSKNTEGNSYYGLAIGFTVMVGAYTVGSISKGAFNPAVAVGLITMGLVQTHDILIFLLANFGGAALAALAFKTLNPTDK